MAKILIPTPLRQFTEGADSVDVAGSTVGDILSTLTTSLHPGLRNNLYTPEGKLRSFVNVYVNDEDIRYLQKDSTAVKESDTISIVPSIAGGQ
jgi:molybdopterin converting factor small subunit